MSGPLFAAFVIAIGALWILFMALPGLSHPPVSPSERKREEEKEAETRICPSCKASNTPEETRCLACGAPLQKAESTPS